MAHSDIVSNKISVGLYLIKRLQEAGLQDCFGVPGDYILRFYQLLEQSNINVIGVCNELNGGYAADGYARIKGLSAMCVTYSVGGYSLLNAVAGAYAENIPMIIIAGSPALSERKPGVLLHHTSKHYHSQFACYAENTHTAVEITDASKAAEQIDDVIIACLSYKKPVFIEIPMNVVDQLCLPNNKPLVLHKPHVTKKVNLKSVMDEIKRRYEKAKRPVLMLGIEIHRYALQDKIEKLIQAFDCPVVTTVLAKSVIDEQSNHYIGVYQGAMSQNYVNNITESADFLLGLGVWLTDVNTGIYTTQYDSDALIIASKGQVTISDHIYESILLEDLLDELLKEIPKKTLKANYICASKREKSAYQPKPNEKITTQRFYERMDQFLQPNDVVIADSGDSMFSAAQLTMKEKNAFVAQAFYMSIGHSVPAAMGIKTANKKLRPLVFVGDGAFQLTCQEMSTMIRHEQNPIIFLMNNKGYLIERVIIDGAFNDIHNWRYHQLPKIFGECFTAKVETEDALEKALINARKNETSLSFIEVCLDKWDASDALLRLGQAVSTQQRK